MVKKKKKGIVNRMEGRKSGQPMGVRKEGCISRTKSHWGTGKMAQGLKALVAKSDDLEKKSLLKILIRLPHTCCVTRFLPRQDKQSAMEPFEKRLARLGGICHKWRLGWSGRLPSSTDTGFTAPLCYHLTISPDSHLRTEHSWSELSTV